MNDTLNNIAEYLRNNQNPIEPGMVDLVFGGVILLCALFGFLYGFKKGLIFTLAATIGVVVVYFTYELVGQSIIDNVLVEHMPQSQEYIDVLVENGINYKEMVFGVVAVVYTLVAIPVSVLVIGTPAHFVVKHLLKNNEKFNLSTKNYKTGKKLLNRFLGSVLGASFALLWGFVLFTGASPSLGLLYKTDEITFNRMYIGDDENNDGRYIYNLLNTASELLDEDGLSETKKTLAKVIDNSGKINIETIEELSPVLDKIEEIVKNDNFNFNTLNNNFKIDEEKTVEEVVKDFMFDEDQLDKVIKQDPEKTKENALDLLFEDNNGVSKEVKEVFLGKTTSIVEKLVNKIVVKNEEEKRLQEKVLNFLKTLQN